MGCSADKHMSQFTNRVRYRDAASGGQDASAVYFFLRVCTSKLPHGKPFCRPDAVSVLTSSENPTDSGAGFTPRIRALQKVIAKPI
jgi:hypothetical protein